MSVGNFSKFLREDVIPLVKNRIQEISLDEIRATMNKQVTALEISSESIRKGSKFRETIRGKVITATGLTKEQSEVAARAMISYFNYLPTFDPTKHIDAKDADNVRLKLPTKTLAVKKKVGRAGMVIIANNFSNISKEVVKFTKAFEEFLSNKGSSDFKGVKREEFIQAKGDFDLFSKRLGTTNGRTNLNIGHLGIAGDPRKTTVAEKAAADVIAKLVSANVLDLNQEIALMRAIEREFETLHIPYSATFTKGPKAKGPYTGKLGEMNIIITVPQYQGTNKSIGGTEKAIFGKLKNRDFLIEIPKLKGSTSIFGYIKNRMDAVFTKGLAKLKYVKAKEIRQIKKSIVKIKGNFNVKINKPKLKYTNPIPMYRSDFDIEMEQTLSGAEGCDLSLNTLLRVQGLMNDTLKSRLISNMGNEGYPGGQRRILNNRTGTFAGSVSIEAMIPDMTNCSVAAMYDYQRDPYSIFDKGGRLYTPTRDIQKLIGGTIREMAVSMLQDRFALVPKRV